METANSGNLYGDSCLPLICAMQGYDSIFRCGMLMIKMMTNSNYTSIMHWRLMLKKKVHFPGNIVFSVIWRAHFDLGLLPMIRVKYCFNLHKGCVQNWLWQPRHLCNGLPVNTKLNRIIHLTENANISFDASSNDVFSKANQLV